MREPGISCFFISTFFVVFFYVTMSGTGSSFLNSVHQIQPRRRGEQWFFTAHSNPPNDTINVDISTEEINGQFVCLHSASAAPVITSFIDVPLSLSQNIRRRSNIYAGTQCQQTIYMEFLHRRPELFVPAPRPANVDERHVPPRRGLYIVLAHADIRKLSTMMNNKTLGTTLKSLSALLVEVNCFIRSEDCPLNPLYIVTRGWLQ
jgi:hypothetical protein